MDFQNILEGIIGSLIAGGISAGLVFLTGLIFGKNKILSGQHNRKFHISKLNPFSIALFVTSFFTILSGFSFYYQWANMSSLITITIFVWVVTIWIYHNQCPNCNKIFKKKHIHREVLGEEKRPFYYRDETIYLYSDGTVKDQRVHGSEKKRMENIRTIRDYFKCKSCGHIWDSSPKEINLDEHSRPKPNIIKTGHRNPDEIT